MNKTKLKEKVDLAEYISNYLDLDQNNKSLCPFHENDTDPSLSVKGKIWKCFGCGVGGDIYNFIMLFHKLSFKEAVIHLAEYLGEEIEDNQAYFKTLKQLQNQFFFSKPKEYMKKRGIDLEISNLFGIGYSTSISIEKLDLLILEELGILNKDHKELDWRFRNTITFPYYKGNNVIGFTFNHLDSQIKYKNIRNTSVFKKSDVFFGYNIAQNYIKEAGYLILVEGFFDVLRLFQIGYRNVVATGGSSLSNQQVSLIKKNTDTVYLMFDGDRAGRIFSVKAYGKLIKENFKIKVFTLPDNQDPDSYFKFSDNLPPLIDIMTFIKEYFEEAGIDLLLSSLGEIIDYDLAISLITSINLLFPNIPKSLIENRLFKPSPKINLKLKKITNQEFLNAWIYGILDEKSIKHLLSLPEFKEAKEIKDKCGYFNLEKISSEVHYPNLSKQEFESILTQINLIHNSLEIKEVIDLKRRLINA